MPKIYKRFSRLVFRFNHASNTSGVKKHPYYLTYENGQYREDELVKIIRGALPHFALTPDEFQRMIKDEDLDEMYRLAFSRISKAKRDKKVTMASYFFF